MKQTFWNKLSKACNIFSETSFNRFSVKLNVILSPSFSYSSSSQRVQWRTRV